MNDVERGQELAVIEGGPRLRLVYFTHIAKIEQRSRIKRAWKDGNDNAHTLEEDLGWFVLYEDSREAIHVGDQPPPGWFVGQRIRVTMEPTNG